MYDMPVYFDAHYFFFNLTASASEPRAVFFSYRVTPAQQASCFLLAQRNHSFWSNMAIFKGPVSV